MKIEKSLSECITPLPDGKFRCDIPMTHAQAASFYEACNVISEQLGRPVSKEEALSLMLDTYLELNDPEYKK